MKNSLSVFITVPWLLGFRFAGWIYMYLFDKQFYPKQLISETESNPSRELLKMIQVTQALPNDWKMWKIIYKEKASTKLN